LQALLHYLFEFIATFSQEDSRCFFAREFLRYMIELPLEERIHVQDISVQIGDQVIKPARYPEGLRDILYMG
jgi:hypothetical protein